jgi:type I restriction enzyme, S subunit
VIDGERMLLGDLTDVVTKGTTPTTLKKNFVSEGIPFLRINNLDNGIIDYSDILYIDDATNQLLKRSVVKSGDFLLTIAGTIGKTVIVPEGAPQMNCNQAIAILRVKDELDKNYLKHWLGTQDAQSQITGAQVTATISNLSLGQIKELKIPLPPLEEQRRIAAILDKADALRRKRQQAIDLTDQLLRSVFLDMFGDPVANPKGWKIDRLKNLSTKICSGSTPVGGSKVYVEQGIVFLRSQNVWKRKLELDDVVYIDETTHRKMNKTSLKNRDILITKTGRINTENSSLGRASFFLGNDDSANINGHVYLVRPKPEAINEFILYILTTQEYRDYIL